MSAGDPSPTEEELIARAFRAWNTGAPNEAHRIITHALRTARESARVATRERDANANWPAMYRMYAELVETEKVARREAEAQLTDRDRMIAELRNALKAYAAPEFWSNDSEDQPFTDAQADLGWIARHALSTSHPIAAAFVARERVTTATQDLADDLAAREERIARERDEEIATLKAGEEHLSNYASDVECEANTEKVARLKAEAALRAHEETIGRLTAALRPFASANYAERPTIEDYRRAHDALAAAPPGEYEQRVRNSVLDEVARFLESQGCNQHCTELGKGPRYMGVNQDHWGGCYISIADSVRHLKKPV